VRNGSMGTCCKSLGATTGTVAGWIVGGWMTMSSSGLKLGGSITSSAGLPKTGGTLGALTVGGMGGGGYIG
jgi:hypothetical protein